MPKIAYEERNFSPAVLTLIAKCNEIIEEYQAQGFDLTLRQLYYQLVSRDIIPNTVRDYKRLGEHVNNARLCGLLDWDAIVDRGRNLRTTPHWTNPAEIIRAARQGFHLDRWQNQRYRPEVWVEKEALIGVITGICNRYDIPFFACKGYNSQSEQWRAARRMQRHVSAGQTPIVFHLGDHDSSGIDMTRDLLDRFTLFMGGVPVERLALNMDQVEQFQPPPNPAKETDSRFASYVELYGYESWELDALDPATIARIIEKAILSIRDDSAWQEIEDEEREQRRVLQATEDHWEEIVDFLQNEE